MLTFPATVKEFKRGEHRCDHRRTRRLRTAELVCCDHERGGAWHWQLIFGEAHVEADAHHAGWSLRGVDTLRENAAQLAVGNQHVVRPLKNCGQVSRAPHAITDC